MAEAKSDYKGRLVDTICPICGKNFVPAPMHVYNDGGKLVCSYHCHLEAFNRRQDAKKKKTHYRQAHIIPGRDEEIRRLAREGVSSKELAQQFNVGVIRIRQIIREGLCEE